MRIASSMSRCLRFRAALKGVLMMVFLFALAYGSHSHDCSFVWTALKLQCSSPSPSPAWSSGWTGEGLAAAVRFRALPGPGASGNCRSFPRGESPAEAVTLGTLPPEIQALIAESIAGKASEKLRTLVALRRVSAHFYANSGVSMVPSMVPDYDFADVNVNVSESQLSTRAIVDEINSELRDLYWHRNALELLLNPEFVSMRSRVLRLTEAMT